MESSLNRILYVITDLEVGGVPLHLCRLATSMHELGHVVRVVSLSPPGPVSEMMAQPGVEVGSCDARTVGGIGALLRLRREFVQFKPEIIHSFLFHANIACRLMAPLAGVSRDKLICEIQTVEIERRWHLTVDRWTHRLCRMEIGNSHSVIDHLHHEAGLPESSLLLVRGGVDLAEVLPERIVEGRDTADRVETQRVSSVPKMHPHLGAGRGPSYMNGAGHGHERAQGMARRGAGVGRLSMGDYHAGTGGVRREPWRTTSCS